MGLPWWGPEPNCGGLILIPVGSFGAGLPGSPGPFRFLGGNTDGAKPKLSWKSWALLL